MVLKTIFYCSLGFVLISCFSCSDASLEQSSSSTRYMTKGELLFEERCIVCHGSDGKLGVSGAKDLSKSTLSTEELVDVLNNGKNGMPAFSYLFDGNNDLDSVIIHLNTLRD